MADPLSSFANDDASEVVDTFQEDQSNTNSKDSEDAGSSTSVENVNSTSEDKGQVGNDSLLSV